MNPVKIVIAVLITIALLAVARRASMRVVPIVTESATYAGLTLEHTCVHIFKGDSTAAQLDVKVTGGLLPEGTMISLYLTPRAEAEKTNEASYRRFETSVVPGQGLTYRVIVPNQGRGSEFSYFFQLEDPSGDKLATVPASTPDKKGNHLWLRFEGSRFTTLLIVHIALMFGGFLLMVMAFMTSLENVHAKPIKTRLGKQVLWATIILFLGTFPIGIWLEYQVYATYWTGIPLGRDLTDSKALIVFIYWLFLLIVLKGSALAANPNRDLVKPAAARYLTIIGVLLSMALYLIPHSSGNF